MFKVISFLFCFTVFSAGIDIDKSVLKWTGKKVTGQHYGKIKFKSADLKLKDGNIQSGVVVVDMKTIGVDDLSGEWKGKFLKHITTGDFFEVDKFPEAILRIKSVKGSKIDGELEIKKKKNPITISFKKAGKVYKGKFKFNRTKFGITYGSGSFFKNLGDKMIYDEVEMEFSVEIK